MSANEQTRALARARDYMNELSRGNDPLTGRPVTDETLESERLKRCFAFLAAYLDRELTRAAHQGEVYIPSPDQAREICTDTDIPAAEFYRRLAQFATAAGQLPVSERQINHYLLRAGLIDARVDSVFVERRVLRANARSEQLGIYDKPMLSPRTGAMMHTLMFPPEVQMWILGLLPDVIAQESRQGQEQEQARQGGRRDDPDLV